MLERETFVRYVHECLGHLHDLAYLDAHPLAGIVQGSRQARPGTTVRRTLDEAIARLKPETDVQQTSASLRWRRYRLLCLRYVEGWSLARIARELNISSRQVSRDQEQAVENLASLLWAWYAPSGDEAIDDRAGRASVSDPAPVDASGQKDLEAELGQLATPPTVEGPTALNDTVEGVADTVARLAEDHGVDLESVVVDTVSPVAVSRVLLRQTLFNLLSGVIHTAGNSRILVSAADTARGVELRLDVRRRPGRPPSLSRKDQLLPDPEMLLATGRRLVESQGGRVEVQRHPHGNFAIVLVLPPTPARNVLVIDDNPDVVGLFRRYLKQTNYRLMHAGTAESALRLATELKPDAITLDLMMPTRDGWEILQQLRGHPSTKNTPVVVCSVLPEHSLALSLGVRAFVAKPVTRAGLLAALESCFESQVPGAHPGWPSGSASPRRS